MNAQLDKRVKDQVSNPDGDPGPVSTGERCYIALASGCYNLLTDPADPIEAWFRLPPYYRAAVCRWRGWPKEWADPSR